MSVCVCVCVYFPGRVVCACVFVRARTPVASKVSVRVLVRFVEIDAHICATGEFLLVAECGLMWCDHETCGHID